MDPTADLATRFAAEGAVMTDGAWESLLDRIGHGLVVPVVGSQMLNDPEGTGGLRARVAARLLEQHRPKIDPGSLTPDRELDQAIALLQRDGQIRQVDLYEAVRAGDSARASRVQHSLLVPSRKIPGELGPVGVKYAMRISVSGCSFTA